MNTYFCDVVTQVVNLKTQKLFLVFFLSFVQRQHKFPPESADHQMFPLCVRVCLCVCNFGAAKTSVFVHVTLSKQCNCVRSL